MNFRHSNVPYILAGIAVILELLELKTSHFVYAISIISAIQMEKNNA